MMRFIICEDNEDFATRFSNHINRLLMPYNFEYRIDKFTEYNKEVEELINKKYEQKIYILDIELTNVSGLEIASIIREQDQDSRLIFVTIHNECQNDIFYSRLLATDFIVKDLTWETRFDSTIKYILKNTNKRRVLSFEFNYSIYRIPFDNILYIEKIQGSKKCLINTEDGEQIQIGTTISELLIKLGPSFFKSHQSCIINIDKIKTINFKENTITFVNNKIINLLSNGSKKGLKEYVANY